MSESAKPPPSYALLADVTPRTNPAPDKSAEHRKRVDEAREALEHAALRRAVDAMERRR